MSEEAELPTIKYCECGCSEVIPEINKRHELAHYKHGHNPQGRGKYNPAWKGDDISYNGLHKWMRDNFLKPKVCEICNVKSQLDIANVTGIYNREYRNWNWLCRKCHMINDGRLERFIQAGINYSPKRMRDKNGRFC